MGPQVFLLAVLDHALRANSTLVDRVDLVTKAYRCPLHRLRVPRLLLPRSGLERSDFVLWHLCDMPLNADNVCLSGKTGSERHRVEMKRLTPCGLWQSAVTRACADSER